MRPGKLIGRVLSLVLALAVLMAPCALLMTSSAFALSRSQQASAMDHGANAPRMVHGDCLDPSLPGKEVCATDCHSWNVPSAAAELQAPAWSSDKGFASAEVSISASADRQLAESRGTVLPRNQVLGLHATGVPIFARTARYRL